MTNFDTPQTRWAPFALFPATQIGGTVGTVPPEKSSKRPNKSGPLPRRGFSHPRKRLNLKR